MARTSYDPGTPTVATKVKPGVYALDSFRGEETAYLVDLNTGRATCSCPHFVKRLAGTEGECKHARQARTARFETLTEKARTIPTHHLPMLLEKHEQEGRLDVALAIRAELFDRIQAAGL
jgi:predicted nucleic acid-binding Zn finger protein